MATIIATGNIERPDLLTPQLAEIENAALAELARDGVVQAAYVHDGRHTVTLILEAVSVTSAESQLAQLPFVRAGQMTVEYAIGKKLLSPEWTRR